MKILKFFLHHKKTSLFILLLLFLFIYGSINASTLQESYEPATPVYRWETADPVKLRGQSCLVDYSGASNYPDMTAILLFIIALLILTRVVSKKE